MTSRGKITLITGCMFSKKTTTLLALYDEYKLNAKKCILVKFQRDNRYNSINLLDIISHDKTNRQASFAVKNLNHISTSELESCDAIMIDEGQFFIDLVEFTNKWADRGKEVFVAALNGTFEREPFSVVAKLLSKVEKIMQLNAQCSICSKEAAFSKRLCNSKEQELIGGSDLYHPRCRVCFDK